MSGEKSLRELSVAAGIVSQLARYMACLKKDITPILISCGVDPATILNPDARIPYERYIAVEEAAAQVSGDPFFGLHMGEWVEPGHYSIIGYLMMNSPTLSDAFKIAGRYFRLLGNAITSRGQIGMSSVKIIYEAPRSSVVVSRHCFETLISSCVTMMRTLTAQPLHPSEVGFTHSSTLPPEEYRRVFGCPVRFGARHNYLVLPLSFGRIPVVQPNPQLLAYFEHYALERIDRDKQTIGQVTDFIRASLGKRNLTIASAAREMGMSVRSLQTRLSEENTGFRELVDETRIRLAKRHLERDSTIEEIALLLGYSEASAFSKAFKKHEGQNPSEYRNLVRQRKTENWS